MKSILIATALTLGLAAPALSKPSGTPEVSTCSVSDVKAEGTSALDCDVYSGNDQLGSDPSDYTVNEKSVFGHNDWEFLGKDETGGGGNSTGTAGLEVTGIDDGSGTWSVTPGFLAQFEEFMIVLKAGNEWAAYLFNLTSADSGTWTSFNGKDLSHLTIYGRGEGDGDELPVPEPAALGLLGLGVVAVAFGRRRRRA